MFYRVDPARFQDSNGDGTGDTDGIAQRLDYIQSLGVDALVLDGRVEPNSLEDLVRAASSHHLRVLLAIQPDPSSGSQAALLQTVHEALSAGAAGIWMSAPAAAASSAGYTSLLTSVRSLLRSFPGDRILVTNELPQPDHMQPSSRPGRSSAGLPGRELVLAPPIPDSAAGLTTIREGLSAAAQPEQSGSNTVLHFAQDPPTGSPDAAGRAAMLLLSRGGAVLDFGDELGLDLFPDHAGAQGEAGLPVMQWTPSNHTPAPVEQAAAQTKHTPASETEFGPYHPYQPPPRDLRGPATSGPRVVPDANVPPAPPDPDTLPGFTAGRLLVPPVDGAHLNVVTEDRDPKSLLNAYRQLIALHHGNLALREGTQTMLDHDAQGVLVWIRRAPAGSRAPAVLVAVNTTQTSVTVSLDRDLNQLHLRTGPMRALFTWSAQPLTGETSGSLVLPPHAVFAGEVRTAGQR